MAMIVRPARQQDMADLMELSRLAGSGMTTMPQSERSMTHRIYRSQEAFIRPEPLEEGETFFLVLEIDGKVVGTASIFTCLGADRPFYSYRISHIANQAPELNIRSETDILTLVNDYHGYSEIGTLFLHPEYRQKGASKLLSFSRFMLMAANPGRFNDKVMAEIRGWTDKNGDFPFWEHVARKFFQLEFDEADRRSVSDFRFIADLMPKYPIYIALLPEEAQKHIGRPHDLSERAMQMLEGEGFRYENLIDIFDGGPSIEARLQDVKTIRRARTIKVVEGKESTTGKRHLLAKPALHRFACIIVHIPEGAEEVPLSPQMMSLLDISPSDQVLISPMEK
ncbi:MAG: arginine N-succinyltransferase [bacterium]